MDNDFKHVTSHDFSKKTPFFHLCNTELEKVKEEKRFIKKVSEQRKGRVRIGGVPNRRKSRIVQTLKIFQDE